MTVDARTRALEQAVLARVETQLSSLGNTTVIGVRCSPGFTWPGKPECTLAGRDVHITVCPSVLGVLAALVDAGGKPGVLVVLTPIEERKLGPDVLARLHRHQLLEASRQTLLQDLAGGRALDPGIINTDWLADALVDHFTDTEADPRDRAVPLTRQDAVDLLLSTRLGVNPTTLDLTTVLEQVVAAVGTRRWQAVDPELRGHLVEEVRDRWGRLVATVLRMAARRSDLLELLLLLDVVGYRNVDVTTAGLRGVLVNELLGPGQLAEDDQLTFAASAVELARRRRSAPDVVAAVDAAEARARAIGIDAWLGGSSVLPSGLDRRFSEAAADLTDTALSRVAGHLDAEQPYQQARIERMRCVLRLRRWLGRPAEPVTTVGPALHQYMDDDGWADRALEEIGLGDPLPDVQRVLDEARRAAVARRDRTDQDVAERLAATATAALGSVLPVEKVLAEVVAPLARDGVRVLLVVLDGVSVATAVGLAGELAGPGGQWREIVRDGRRTPVLATLPSETTYSRTSLLTGALCTGTAADERAGFGSLAAWSGRTAQLFHRADLGGAAGGDLGGELSSALEDRDTHVVGVVLNTIDDSLTKGAQGNSAHLGVDQITWLRTLLQRASLSERVVVFVSDHGHVLDRGEALTELRTASGGGARWRPAGAGPVNGAEVAVAGPRVLTSGHRAVFAATPGLRYAKRTHGYHGGAALAEITVPLLAFVRPGVAVPVGWALAGDPTPEWWNAAPASGPASPLTPSVVERASASASTPELRATAAQPDLFDSAEQRGPVSIPGPGRGAAIVRSTVYLGMQDQVPAPSRLSAPGVGRLLDVALAAGGTISFTDALAAAGLQGRNERGVFSSLRRLLNVQGYEVVTVSEADRTVTINRQLLDDQFPTRP